MAASEAMVAAGEHLSSSRPVRRAKTRPAARIPLCVESPPPFTEGPGPGRDWWEKALSEKSLRARKHKNSQQNQGVGANSRTTTFGPFGELLRVSGPAAKDNQFRFSTKRTDNTSDLVLYEYRLYSPSTGRWLGRDPAEEQQSLNLYCMALNNQLTAVDPLGLWHYHLTPSSRRYQKRAQVVADRDKEPYSDLATLVHLDANEVQKWLETWVPNEWVNECNTFTVPNTVYLNRVSWHPVWMVRVARRERKALEEQGFHVVYQADIDNGAVLRQFADSDIYGFINVAHGESEPYGHGEIETTDSRGIKLTTIQSYYLHHKLGGFMLIQCWGDELDWRQITAHGAYFWAGHGKIHFWDVPTAEFL